MEPVASCSRKRKRPDDDEDGDHGNESMRTACATDNNGDERMAQDDGEREATAEPTFDYSIQVTPFNLDDELEEGDFDEAGNFVFKKKEKLDETNNDTWAESIDWSKVQERSPDEQEDEPEAAINPIECYKQMLRIMKPSESVQRTIRRLGNNMPKRRPNKNKFEKPEMPEVAEARRKLDSIIGLAHGLLENGDMDIYQKSYEDLEEAING